MRLSLRVITVLLFLVAAVASMPASGPREDLVVSTAWLNQHLKDPNLVLLHVGEPGEYKAKHLPGARFVALEDISAPMNHENPKPTDIHLELPDPAKLHDTLAGLGISHNSTIVVYYGNDWYSPSTRVIFTLQYAGLGDRTRLLDGGMRAWVKDGYATTAEVAPVKTGTLSPLKTVDMVVDSTFVTANKAAAGIAIVDGRDKVFYDGVENSGPRGGAPILGHIPGAHSLPFNTVFDDNGVLLPADKLQALFTQAGVKPSDEVIGYCHIGQQATAVLFAARTLGHKVRLYDGSMNDWTIRKLPLEIPKSLLAR